MRLSKNSLRIALLGMALMLVLGMTSAAAQDRTIVNVYSSGDTNITDWYQNQIIPAFEAAYPEYQVQFTNSRAAGDEPIVERAIAALTTGDDPLVEVMDVDPRNFQAAVEAELWYMPTVEEVPNLANLSAAAQVTDLSPSYRGSQVLIAYNSELIAPEDVPTTFNELILWIQNNPGQFIYCRPDRGGSGGNFVRRALYHVSGNDPALWQGEFNQQLVDTYYPLALDLLAYLDPFMYDEGAYPAGNNPVLELFASGEVSMISAWSDQAIQGINRGFLPETTQLVQFTDLPMPGGYTQLSIPRNAANLPGALAFVNFMLSVEGQTSVVSDIGGFPAIEWSLLPADVQERFNDVITDNVPLWTGGDYNGPLTEGWYNTVATDIDPNS
ncbi:MAG: extracellular solute-binding protein [Chloroflexota bacterium]|nr:extracellular solute-binding protein [Chloroflexota bacterium]